MKYIVVDWMGNVMFKGEEFNSFEDARDAIDEEASVMFETEEERDAYCEDMYAIPAAFRGEDK